MIEPTSELTVRHVMVAEPITVSPEQTVLEVVRLMNRLRIGAVLVCRGETIEGIFTERDLLRHAGEAPPGWRERPVADWMTRNPYSIDPDTRWEDAMARMEHLRVRHLPVIENGRVIGIVSARVLIGRRTDHLNGLVEERTAELLQANAALEERNAEMRHNMALAGRLQNRLVLPTRPPDWNEIGWGVHFAPLDPLGGDFYDFALPDDRHLGVLIADASGHSIPAALVAVMTRVAFTNAAPTTPQPGAVLAIMNDRLQGLTEERFVTAFYGVLDRETLRLTYANAGHPPPIRYSARAGSCHLLTGRGFLLGVMPNVSYEEASVQLEPGDRIVFHTDGVLETRDATGEGFGSGRLVQYLTAHGTWSAADLTHGLVVALAEFRGDHPLTDDVTMLVAEVKGRACHSRPS